MKTKKQADKNTTITYKYLEGQHSLYEFSDSAGILDIGQIWCRLCDIAQDASVEKTTLHLSVFFLTIFMTRLQFNCLNLRLVNQFSCQNKFSAAWCSILLFFQGYSVCVCIYIYKDIYIYIYVYIYVYSRK